jgi:DNA-directed RNA polymerase subunit RPC12/RpoP
MCENCQGTGEVCATCSNDSDNCLGDMGSSDEHEYQGVACPKCGGSGESR